MRRFSKKKQTKKETSNFLWIREDRRTAEGAVPLPVTIYSKPTTFEWSVDLVNCTCSAINLKPLSGLSHSYVSPKTGLKGLLPARW